MTVAVQTCEKCDGPMEAGELRGRSYRHCLSCGKSTDYCDCTREVAALLGRVVWNGEPVINEWAYAKNQVKRKAVVREPIAPTRTAHLSELALHIATEVAAIRERFPDLIIRTNMRHVGNGTLEYLEHVIIFTVAADGWTPSQMRVLVRIPWLYPDAFPDCIYVQDEAVTPYGLPLFESGVWRCMQDDVRIAGEYWHCISWHLSADTRRGLFVLATTSPDYFRAVTGEAIPSTPSTSSDRSRMQTQKES